MFMDILGMLYLIFYFFTATGMHIFGGTFTFAVDLEGQGFNPDYIYNNFNDFSSGMVTLFEFLMVNNWNIQMDIYAYVTGNSIVKLFFIAFYLFGYILALGILVALTIDVIVQHLTNEKADKKKENEEAQKGSAEDSKLKIQSSVVNRSIRTSLKIEPKT